MALLFCGLSYRRAPVAVRERFSLAEADRPGFLAALRALPGVRGAVLLSTCNRTEFYLSCAATAPLHEPLVDLLSRTSGLMPEEVRPLLAWRRGTAAARHLLSVSSGLDSLVVGENQILAQVKTARALSEQHGAMDGVLERLCTRAVQTGRRVRTETGISRGVASVSHAAVELARQRLGSLQDVSVLVLGAGKMGSLALRHLESAGVREIRVSNRTLERACELARGERVTAVPIEDLEDQLAQVDLVMSATGAPHLVVTRRMLERLAPRRDGRPLVLVDLALPRDVDPACATLPGVHVFDLDDLRATVQRSQTLRSVEAERARAVVEGELQEWLLAEADRRAVPAILALRGHLESGFQRRLARLQHLPLQGDLLERSTRRALQKLMHGPTAELRRLARQGHRSARLMREARSLYRLPHGRRLSELLLQA